MKLDFSHLTPFEPAARIYCAMNDQPADAMMEVPHPFLLGVQLKRPAWHFPAENMINLSQMLTSMRQAALAEGANDATH